MFGRGVITARTAQMPALRLSDGSAIGGDWPVFFSLTADSSWNRGWFETNSHISGLIVHGEI
jgi:hypothetical protein